MQTLYPHYQWWLSLGRVNCTVYKTRSIQYPFYLDLDTLLLSKSKWPEKNNGDLHNIKNFCSSKWQVFPKSAIGPRLMWHLWTQGYSMSFSNLPLKGRVTARWSLKENYIKKTFIVSQSFCSPANAAVIIGIFVRKLTIAKQTRERYSPKSRPLKSGIHKYLL